MRCGYASKEQKRKERKEKKKVKAGSTQNHSIAKGRGKDTGLVKQSESETRKHLTWLVGVRAIFCFLLFAFSFVDCGIWFGRGGRRLRIFS